MGHGPVLWNANQYEINSPIHHSCVSTLKKAIRADKTRDSLVFEFLSLTCRQILVSLFDLGGVEPQHMIHHFLLHPKLPTGTIYY